jgi:uncharacterized protein
MDEHQGIEIRNCQFGKGIFAMKNFKIYDKILAISGRSINYSDTLDLDEKESYSLQIETNKYILLSEPSCYINHSCEPNVGIMSNTFVAIKEIEIGCEIFFEYSTSMLERSWSMDCKCGSHKCRGLIQDFDLLPQELQEKYLQLNIVLPFIKKNLNAVLY